MKRRSARLLLWIGAALMLPVLPSCLLPNDGAGAELLGPYPPEIDMDQLDPRSIRLDINIQDCTSLTVRANEITDLDSDRLLIRWVVNNDLPNTKWLDDEESTLPPGQPHRTIQGIDHAADFRFDPNDATTLTGVLTLYVSDAPAWAIEEPDTSSGDPIDLSGIAFGPDDDPAQFSVTEARWTFNFLQGGGQCDFE